MSDLAWIIALLPASVAGHAFIGRWHVTACTCGRRREPWFGVHHERHGLMVAQAVIVSICTVACVWTSGPLWIIFGVLVSAQAWKAVAAHGSGKRRWPKRVAGWVRINQHGRLVVQSAGR